MKYLEKRKKVLGVAVIFRQRAKKSRGLSYTEGESFRSLHVWRWSLLFGKKTGKHPVFNI